ncbi:MAG TPA: ACT domain-containing protein [Myxococcales bacterium LLY-WYZ-16_1]|nr:ACT domain-containing protein [Myxococcales bacterium LLY-WYZ-16_1]
MSTLVFTLIGPDRPGLVEQVAQCIARHEGNWEESQLVRLGGQFAGLVRVSVPPAHRTKLRAALSELPDLEMVVADAEEDGDTQRTCRLELIGADRPGIIREIGKVLAETGVNMVQLDTHTERAPMSGEPMFRMEAKVVVPDRVKTPQLRSALESIANELMADITLAEPSSD